MPNIQDLRDELEGFISSKERQREKFMNSFSNDPGRAIESYAAGLVSMEETARLAECIIEIAESDNNELDLVDAANYVIKVQGKNLERHSLYPPSSSGQFSNLVEIYKVHGIANLKDELTGLGGILDYLNDQREREQQGQENEALFEVLKSSKKSLLYSVRNYNQAMESSKTKKDELANKTAAEALYKELSILKTRAKQYGLGEKLEEVTINSY